MSIQKLRIAFGTPEYVTENHFDGGLAKCLEAMALGKVVMGTPEAGFDEVITDEETGFLVSANDVDALARKIIYAWTHPGLQEIGNAARQKILDFSPEKITEALLGYYQEVLQENI